MIPEILCGDQLACLGLRIPYFVVEAVCISGCYAVRPVYTILSISPRTDDPRFVFLTTFGLLHRPHSWADSHAFHFNIRSPIWPTSPAQLGFHAHHTINVLNFSTTTTSLQHYLSPSMAETPSTPTFKLKRPLFTSLRHPRRQRRDRRLGCAGFHGNFEFRTDLLHFRL